MVHRGHCVFDTANVHAGRTYGLDFHLDRLFTSAALARIERLPPRESIKEAILATIATTGERNGIYARYWLSAGRGDFFVSPRGLREHGAIDDEIEGGASFYVIVHRSGGKALMSAGVAEATVGVPLKTKLLANIKSNNYLLNAMTAMEAEDKGGALGVQLDENGCIVESSIASIAIVTPAGVLKAPTFDLALASTTLLRAFDLARKAVSSGELPVLTGVEQAPVTLDEAYGAAEMLSLGGALVSAVASAQRTRSAYLIASSCPLLASRNRSHVLALRWRHRANHLAERQADRQRTAGPGVSQAVAEVGRGSFQ